MDSITEFMVPYMIREKVKYVTTFHDNLAGHLFKSRIPVLFKKSVPRFTGISKQLLEHIGEDFKMQDGDGDVVFT